MAGPETHRARLHRRALRVQTFLVAYNVIEGLVAITVGVMAGSVALVAFGFDSAIEVAAAGAIVWRLRRAPAGADRETETTAERRALRIVAATFLLLAIYIWVEAGTALVTGDEADAPALGLALAALSVVVMPTVAVVQQRTGRSIGSRSMVADAVETWICTALSFVLLLGLALNAAFGWWWADPAGALAMTPVIVWQGFDTWRDANGHDH